MIAFPSGVRVWLATGPSRGIPAHMVGHHAGGRLCRLQQVVRAGTRLLLHNDRALPDLRPADQFTDLDLDEGRTIEACCRQPNRTSHDRERVCSRSSQNLIAQTCCGFRARFAPGFLPTFHGRRSLAPGSYSDRPVTSSSAANVPPNGDAMVWCRWPKADG